LTMMLSELFSYSENKIIKNQNQSHINNGNGQTKIIHKFKTSNSRFGKGCFADQAIVKGETICFFEGETICWEEFHKRYIEDRIRLDDPLQISETQYIELYIPYIYFNHSCNPNSGFRGKNELIALKKIMPGEEIYYDYSSVSWDDRWTKTYGAWTMKCECGEKNCRKVIGDFPTISNLQKKKYIRLGVIPSFILEKIAREKKEYPPSDSEVVLSSLG
jgi:uncharacterized protein